MQIQRRFTWLLLILSLCKYVDSIYAMGQKHVWRLSYFARYNFLATRPAQSKIDSVGIPVDSPSIDFGCDMPTCFL